MAKPAIAYTFKRLYARDASGAVVVENGRPKIIGVKLLRPKNRWHLSPDQILKYSAEGWLAMTGDKVIVKHDGGELAYKVQSGPGMYCCHCQQPQETGRHAAAHVAAEHAGTPSPDTNNPSGYRQDHHYVLIKE